MTVENVISSREFVKRRNDFIMNCNLDKLENVADEAPVRLRREFKNKEGVLLDTVKVLRDHLKNEDIIISVLAKKDGSGYVECINKKDNSLSIFSVRTLHDMKDTVKEFVEYRGIKRYCLWLETETEDQYAMVV